MLGVKCFQEGGRNENSILKLSTGKISKGVRDQRMEKRGDNQEGNNTKAKPIDKRSPSLSEAEVSEIGRAGAVGAVTGSKAPEKPVRVICGQLRIRTGNKWEAHVGGYQK